MRVVVVGGGISGLSAAWNISRRLPTGSSCTFSFLLTLSSASVTLLEASPRFGGNISVSDSIDRWQMLSSQTVKGPWDTLVEQGPRSLRGKNATATFEMVSALCLQDRMIVAGGSGPSDLTASKFVLVDGRLHEIAPHPLTSVRRLCIFLILGCCGKPFAHQGPLRAIFLGRSSSPCCLSLSGLANQHLKMKA
jgi:protoporphyrinogen oxidase